MAPIDRTVGRSPILRVGAGSRTDASAVLEAAMEAATGTDVAVAAVGSAGIDGLVPLVAATVDGTTAYHSSCSPDHASDLVAPLEAGTVPTDGAHAIAKHDPATRTLPAPQDGPLAAGRRRMMGRCGWIVPTSPAEYENFASIDAQDGPDGVHELIADIGLRGRGRGDADTDAPVAEQWTLARETDGDPVLVVNGNGSDPRTDADRLLLESVPVSVLDGALAVAGIVGAADVVVSVTETDHRAAERVQEAVAVIEADDRLPTGGSGDPTVQVVEGPDRFIAGEPTIALEALEGNDRLEARRRPPEPAEYGLYGRPTVIHTPRTLAQVRAAIRHADWFDPVDADPGTRLVRVTGDVKAPATVELPTGGALESVLSAVEVPGRFKIACVGGRFGGLTRSLSVSAGADALTAAGLGTEGIVEILDDGRCPVAISGTRARFAEEENCGRCVPCREGSQQLTALLRQVYDGTYDDDGLRELTRVMRETSLCGFGVAAARPVTTAMDAFETEFRAHAEGRCPAGVCGEGNS